MTVQLRERLGPVIRVKRLLRRLFPDISVMIGPRVRPRGFSLKILEGKTTYRVNTGEMGVDFRFFPVVTLTADWTGTFRLDWSYITRLGEEIILDSGPIVNHFSDLEIGKTYELRLVDSREPAVTGRDPTRGGAIALGDIELAPRGEDEYIFQSNIVGTFKSPSGATSDFNLQLGPEPYRYYTIHAMSPTSTLEIIT